jgi:hypothetical protein
MLAIALLAAGAALEVEISGGVAHPLAPAPAEDDGPSAVALQARAGVDFADHLTVSGAVFGVPGSGTTTDSCGSDCRGNASFSALSGLAIIRLHSAGEVQAYVEGGLGIGQLSSLSGDDLFENPALHGGTGLSLWLGLGGRWFVTPRLAVGLTGGWTNWSNISRPAFTFGATDIPATTSLKASALLLMFSVGWRPD